MYLSPEHVRYQNPFWYDYFLSMPFQPENYYDVAYDETRQFAPWFPSPGGPIGTSPGGPIGTPPGGPPGFPPSFPPQGQGPDVGPPSTPPPSFVPTQEQQAGVFAVDPGSIRRCLFRYTYVWLRNRQQFWFYPTFVGRRSISGYRWTGFRWVFFGIDLREIQSFTCF
jgi:hypothetical protein